MAEFAPFDLGRVLQVSESIKALRRDGENDKLRQAYVGEQIASAQQTRAQQAQTFDTESQQRMARSTYLAAQAVANSPDPVAAARQLAPEMISMFEKEHGAGSFQSLTPDVVKQIASMGMEKAAAAAGINLQPDPNVRAQQQFTREMDDRNFGQQKQLAGMQFGQQKEMAGIQNQYSLGQIRERGAQEIAATEAAAPLKSAKNVQQLRKEFRSLQSVKDYETVLPLIEAAKRAPDNGYGDLQLVYTAGKILDPGSVVREGELALTIASGSPLQRLLGTTRFALEKGGRMNPKLRQQLVGMLQERVGATQQAYTRDYDQYSQYAQESGAEPGNVVGTRPESAFGQQNQQPAQQQQAPTATGPNGQKLILRNGQWVPLGG
jgi:hypothetical protein